MTTDAHSMDRVAYGGMSHSAPYCNKRCMFCKQVHDAGLCELFRNFQALAKCVRTKGAKEKLSPEINPVRLRALFKLGRPPTTTGLVPIGLHS
ncbi:hypothetical protein PC123_g20874 [Phytophthora cactorum]|nr:hypothetical protein PC123_g20874 [Phytophthora cactorum]